MTTIYTSRSPHRRPAAAKTATVYPVSTAQLNFLRTLIGDRDLASASTATLTVATSVIGGEFDQITSKMASAAIDELKCLPRKPQPVTDRAAEGYYVRNDVVFKVVANQAGTGTYAKRLFVVDGRGSWEYAAGVGRDMAREGLAPLSVEDAARLSHHLGVCVVCAKTLTKKESVARGIGPVCRKRLAS